MNYLGLLLCLSAFNLASAASQQQELDNLRSRIVKMQREMERTNVSKSNAMDALRESERAISDSNRTLAELTQQRNVLDQNLGKLQRRTQDLAGVMQDQQQLLSKQLYRQYTSGNPSYFEQFFNGQETNQLARNLHYYQYIARDRAAGLSNLRDNLSELQASKLATQAQRTELAELSAKELTQRANLQKGQQEKQLMLKKFSQQLRQQRREVNRLQRDESQLAQLVKKLAQMLAQRKSNSMFGNDNLPDGRFEGRLFTQLKGKLAWPVKGLVTNRFGTPRPDSPVLWKGLFVKSSSGKIVKVIAAGRVVFADWLRGFGNLLIIDHGMGYMSLYGNNETLYKQVGDLLVGGETIATVGNSGGNEDSGLYFELRHESKPFDPITWLAKK
ncbi:MAG: peptidoglycan DD-metalloendopeptidase family protein [Gallionella sp.]